MGTIGIPYHFNSSPAALSVATHPGIEVLLEFWGAPSGRTHHINVLTMMMRSALAALLFAPVAHAAGPSGPMNKGGDYTIANPKPGHPKAAQHRGEFFELLGPAKTGHYGDVNWHPETMALPPEIVARFDGKVMAVTGMESDIVYVNADGSHTSIPCTEHYNHHFSGSMSGKAATRIELDRAIVGSDGYLPGMQALGMQPEQQGVGWVINEPQAIEPLPSGAACNVTGRWLNKLNGIYVDITQTGETSFTASCEGSVGWKGATGNLTAPTSAQPQGGLTLWHTGDKVIEHATFSASSAANAPACSEITFSPSNKWCREPFCGGSDPAPAPAPIGIPSVQSFSVRLSDARRLCHCRAA